MRVLRPYLQEFWRALSTVFIHQSSWQNRKTDGVESRILSPITLSLGSTDAGVTNTFEVLSGSLWVQKFAVAYRVCKSENGAQSENGAGSAMEVTNRCRGELCKSPGSFLNVLLLSSLWLRAMAWSDAIVSIIDSQIRTQCHTFHSRVLIISFYWTTHNGPLFSLSLPAYVFLLLYRAIRVLIRVQAPCSESHNQTFLPLYQRSQYCDS